MQVLRVETEGERESRSKGVFCKQLPDEGGYGPDAGEASSRTAWQKA